MHNYVDRVNFHHSHSHKSASGPRDSEKDIYHVESHHSRDGNDIQHKEMLGGHEIVNHVNTEHRAAHLGGADKYDDDDDDRETVNHELPSRKEDTADNLPKDGGDKVKHEENKLPADDDGDYDDYEDDKGDHLHRKQDVDVSLKNKEKVSVVDHEYEVVNELPSEVGKRDRDGGDDSYGVRKQQRGGDVVDKRMELRQQQDLAAKQTGRSGQDDDLGEVELEDVHARPQKSQRDETQEHREDVWRRNQMQEQRDKMYELGYGKSHRDKTQEQRDDAWHLQQLNDGVQASHLRSHNIAPVPRVYASSLVNHVDASKQSSTKPRSGYDDVADGSNAEKRRQSAAAAAAASDSYYFLIHNGRASRANGAMHPSLYALPDHVPPEAYIFTSSRSYREDNFTFYCICIVKLYFSDTLESCNIGIIKFCFYALIL